MNQSQINKSLVGVALVLFAVLSFLSYRAFTKKSNQAVVTEQGSEMSPTPTVELVTEMNPQNPAEVIVKNNKTNKDSVTLYLRQMVTIVNKNASDISFLPPTGDFKAAVTVPDGHIYTMRFVKPGTYNLSINLNNSQKKVEIHVL